MGYTLIEYLRPANGESPLHNEPYHYEGDVSAILNQPNVNATKNVIKVGLDKDDKEVALWIRVGVHVGADGKELFVMDGPDFIGGLPCPPYNQKLEGRFYRSNEITVPDFP